MNMLEIQILAPNMYKDPIGAMDMNTCSAWSQMYIWAIFAGVVLRSWAGERTTQFFLFIYLHFIMFFLVEFSDVAWAARVITKCSLQILTSCSIRFYLYCIAMMY